MAAWPTCLSASAGTDPKTGAGPDAAKVGVGPSSDMVTGEAALVLGAGAGPWAVMREEEGVAGVDVGVVVGSAAEVVAGVGASPLVLIKVEGRMGVGVGVGVGVRVGWESCEVLWTPVEDESGALEACESASLRGEEWKLAEPGSAAVSSSAADESWRLEMPDVASAGACAWLTPSSLLEDANSSGVEGDSDMLTSMPSLYLPGEPPSGLVSVISINQSINQSISSIENSSILLHQLPQLPQLPLLHPLLFLLFLLLLQHSGGRLVIMLDESTMPKYVQTVLAKFFLRYTLRATTMNSIYFRMHNTKVSAGCL